ncbi:MAG: DUF3800 domain-containing protein [Methylocella sp.]
MTEQPMELLEIPAHTLVFYVDDSGDERLNDQNHPIFAFGGVACVTEFHIEMARTWQAMKSVTFKQIKGPLHAKTHLRESKLQDHKRAAVLSAMADRRLGRFGTIITSSTVVRMDRIVQIACLTLANRLSTIAAGMVQIGLWDAERSPPEVILVFEHSSRLASQIEQHFTNLAIDVNGHPFPVSGCFIPKSVANPFLEMADFVVNTIARNVKHQLAWGCVACTPNFQALFRDVGPPLADYLEVTNVI